MKNWRWRFPFRGVAGNLLILVFFIPAVFLAVRWREGTVDRTIRSEMLGEAISLSSSINPHIVSALAFAPSDTCLAEFRRLESQIKAYQSVSDFRGIWTMTLRDGVLLFGPESYESDEPLGEGLPGEVYENPPERDFEIFRTGEAFTLGPYTDEFGTFISASAPVFDPATGRVMMVVGLDEEADRWLRTTTRARLEALLLCLIPALLIVLGRVALNRRRDLSEARWGLLRHTEVILVGSLGVALTLIIGFALKSETVAEERSEFDRVARSHADWTRNNLTHLRNSVLGSLARFYENSDMVLEQEFQRFSTPLMDRPGIVSLAWVSMVTPGSEPTLPQSVSEDTMFFVDRLSVNGSPCISEGEDLGLHPEMREALRNAMVTGLTTMTEPFPLADGGTGAVVFRYARNSIGKQGFAAMVVDLNRLLTPPEAYGTLGTPLCNVHLYRLSAGSQPELLAYSNPYVHAEHSGIDFTTETLSDDYSIHPIFAFGEAFALILHPGHDLAVGAASGVFLLALGIGSAITALLCALVVSQIRRETTLEREVRSRTAELAHSETRYRLIAENMADVITLMDLNLVSSYVSPSVTNLTGYSLHEAYETPMQKLLDPESFRYMRKAVAEELELEKTATAKPDRARNLELKLVTKSGGIRWVESGLSFMRDENGRPSGILATTRDISERRRAAEAVRCEHAQLMSIFDSIDQAIYIADMDTHELLFANRAIQDMFNTTLTGKTCYRVLQNRDDPCPFCTNDILRTLAGEPYQWDFENPGLGRTFHIVDRLIQWPDGRQVRFEMAVDITEQVKAEAKRLEMETQINQIQKLEAVGRLAGGIAHDFNNMLSIIMGHTEIAMVEPSVSETLKQHLEEIRKAGGRSVELVAQLLAFARKQSISPRVLDLNAAVSDMMRMLQRLLGEDIDLLWLPCADPWPVNLDPTQLSQILINLLINSRDAIRGKGKVTVETSRQEVDEDYCLTHKGFVSGRFTVLRVTDDGHGMDAETASQVFEPFFTTKELGKGTGLGLSTVYGIVKQNNGFIQLYTEPGNGTTFSIFLPGFFGERIAETVTVRAPENLTGSETILLVEDEPSLLSLGASMLESLGYTVITAGTPDDAVGLFREHEGEIHLVMTDVVMPGMNGSELCDVLKNIRPGLRVLYMSGYTADAILHRGIIDPGIHFLQKPFPLDDLARAVRAALADPPLKDPGDE
jgi:PAS domain S-box-containing protein